MSLPFLIGKDELTLAQDHSELTIKQTFELINVVQTDPNNMGKMVAVFLDVSPDVTKDVKWGNMIKDVLPHISGFETPSSPEKHPLPPTISIDGKIIAIPEHLELMSWGQHWGLNDFLVNIQQVDGYLAKDRMASIIMICLWKELGFGVSFSFAELRARLDLFDEVNYFDAYAVEVFFWSKLIELRRKERGGWRLSRMLTKSKLDHNVFRLMGTSPRSMPWPAETRQNTNQS